MIASIDFTSFGSKLLNLRESLGFTRKDIEYMTGLNKDTIYNIEKGLTVPKYETLEILSVCYHEDLLDLLSGYRSSSKLIAFERMLEDLIYSASIDDLKIIDHEFENIKKYISLNNVYYYNNAVEQYELFILGIKMYNEKNYKQCCTQLENALKITNKNFNLKHWNHSKYSIFELRILLLFSISLSYLNETSTSNTIIKYCMETIEEISDNQINVLKFMITCLYNLSYNYHNIDRHNDALIMAQKGIDFCISNNMMYCLPHLFFRKGIALHLLKKDSFLYFLQQGINLFRITNQETLADLFIKITKDKYGIELN